jgi:hypothetical protein
MLDSQDESDFGGFLRMIKSAFDAAASRLRALSIHLPPPTQSTKSLLLSHGPE